MLFEELADPKLVDFASERVQILVPRAIHGPELFRFACVFEQGQGLVQWRVGVTRTRDHEDGRANATDVVDGPKGVLTDADFGANSPDNERCNPAPQHTKRAEPNAETVLERLTYGAVYGFKHIGIGPELGRAQQCGGAAHGHADHSNALAAARVAQEFEGRLDIEALERSKCDSASFALTVSLKIGKQYSIAGAVKETCACDHTATVITDAVQKKHRSGTWDPSK